MLYSDFLLSFFLETFKRVSVWFGSISSFHSTSTQASLICTKICTPQNYLQYPSFLQYWLNKELCQQPFLLYSSQNVLFILPLNHYSNKIPIVLLLLVPPYLSGFQLSLHFYLEHFHLMPSLSKEAFTNVPSAVEKWSTFLKVANLVLASLCVETALWKLLSTWHYEVTAG